MRFVKSISVILGAAVCLSSASIAFAGSSGGTVRPSTLSSSYNSSKSYGSDRDDKGGKSNNNQRNNNNHNNNNNNNNKGNYGKGRDNDRYDPPGRGNPGHNKPGHKHDRNCGGGGSASR